MKLKTLHNRRKKRKSQDKITGRFEAWRWTAIPAPAGRFKLITPDGREIKITSQGEREIFKPNIVGG